MKAKRDSEIQNTLDYLLSGDVTRKQAAKRLQQLCEDYCDSQIKPVNGVDTSQDQALNLADVSVSLLERSKKIELLEAYSTWLTKNGYMDTDWRDEEPNAIESFLGNAR